MKADEQSHGHGTSHQAWPTATGSWVWLMSGWLVFHYVVVTQKCWVCMRIISQGEILGPLKATQRKHWTHFPHVFYSLSSVANGSVSSLSHMFLAWWESTKPSVKLNCSVKIMVLLCVRAAEHVDPHSPAGHISTSGLARTSLSYRSLQELWI